MEDYQVVALVAAKLYQVREGHARHDLPTCVTDAWTILEQARYQGEGHVHVGDTERALIAAGGDAYAKPADELGPLPDIATYNSFVLRGKDYATRVLLPGGMCAGNGCTVTAKLKKCLVSMAGTNDLKEIPVGQWKTIWAVLDNAAKLGNENAVTFVTGVLLAKERKANGYD